MSGRARRYSIHSEQLEGPIVAPKSAADVTNVLGQTVADLRARKLDPRIATAIGYLSNVLLKSIETSDIEARIAKLEALSKTTEGNDVTAK